MIKLYFILFLALLFTAGCQGGGSDLPDVSRKPSLFIIGDSTVNNSGNQLRGWGNVIDKHFDLDKINVINRARGGRSSRTYHTEGLWDTVLAEIMPGDYVMIQFGHNDSGSLTDAKNRASLKGIGTESLMVNISSTGKEELVLTYGAYLRKYITDAQAKGAIPIVCSPVPRNIWNSDNSQILRNNQDYGLWARQIADKCRVGFIDLNEITALKYEKLGNEKVKEFFPGDHTHTNTAGALVNAESVVEGVQLLRRCGLNRYIK